MSKVVTELQCKEKLAKTFSIHLIDLKTKEEKLEFLDFVYKRFEETFNQPERSYKNRFDLYDSPEAEYLYEEFMSEYGL